MRIQTKNSAQYLMFSTVVFYTGEDLRAVRWGTGFLMKIATNKPMEG